MQFKESKKDKEKDAKGKDAPIPFPQDCIIPINQVRFGV